MSIVFKAEWICSSCVSLQLCCCYKLVSVSLPLLSATPLRGR
jgi:hypothetical protein